MARPAYQQNEATAKEKLKAAFWELLTETSYRRITVKLLTERAKLNPNTFYYHYDTMDALALDALNDEKLSEIPSVIRSHLLQDRGLSFGDALQYITVGDRWKKLRLFINSDSVTLQQHFYNMLEQFWLSLIGVEKNQLSAADALDLTFILHGAISIIRLQAEEYRFDFVEALPERPLGIGIMQTLENLIEKYQSDIYGKKASSV
ncbi:MAG: TetR/AcrR family transcriptional regulator [Oscillospiraceae bacterium]|nr:TetR/AcrR family transcriptional regulator [Oscillospiraceae bacterium]